MSAVKFISPSPGAEEKIDEGTGPENTYSEVNTINPINTVAVGALGVGAIGSVLWSLYMADLEEKKKRRRIDGDVTQLNHIDHRNRDAEFFANTQTNFLPSLVQHTQDQGLTEVDYYTDTTAAQVIGRKSDFLRLLHMTIK